MIFASGMPNASLSLAGSMRFSMFGNSSPNAPMRVNPRAARFMKAARSGPNRSRRALAKPAEIARLERGARDNERAAEGAFLAGLAVAVVGHELRAGGALIVLDVLIEHRPRARAEMRHHVFAEQPAGIGEPFGMLVGRRVEHQARVLRRPCRQHHDARFLHLPLLLGVVILDAGHLVALRVAEHARDGR